MKEYIAHYLVDIQKCLDRCSEFSSVGRARHLRDREVREQLIFVCEQTKALGLRSTEQAANRLFDGIGYGTNDNELRADVQKIIERFHDDIVSLIFFYLPSDRLDYYQKTDKFGEEFKVNFPTANAEIIEAGNCFAFDRYTACAFHLMRSLEVVLKVIFRTLQLPPLSTAGARNWNGVLREIKDKLEADKAMPDHAFYDGAYAFLAAAKNPMRNATMHVDAVYDETSAKQVFDAVGAFMRHVATKLKE
jgi:hypothetical protein